MTDRDRTILHEGKLYRYVAETFLKKAYWKECWGVLYSNGNLKIFKDKSDVKDIGHKPIIDLDLQQLVLYLAFGEYALKLNPPRIKDDKSQNGANLIAIPKDEERQIITWLCTPDQQDLMSWIEKIAIGISVQNKPPLLGGKRGEEKKFSEQVKKEFGLQSSNLQMLEWQIYWLHTLSLARKSKDKGTPTVESMSHLTKTPTNLTDEEHYDHNERQGEKFSSLQTTTLDSANRAKNIKSERSPKGQHGCRRQFEIDSNNSKGFLDSTLAATSYYHVQKLPNGSTKSEIIINVKHGNNGKPQIVTKLPNVYQSDDFIYVHTLKNEESHRKVRLFEKEINQPQHIVQF